MKILVAETAGFCFGVRRAVEMAEALARESDDGICTYGPLIHNDTAIADLKSQGVCPLPADIDSIDRESDSPEWGNGSGSRIIMIRAHGVGKETEAALNRRFGTVVDATCPFVKKIHRLVEEHSKAGEQIVILGSKSHPEVVGIRGWVGGDSFVAADETEASALDLDPEKRVCIVAQTTFHFNKFQDLVEIIKEKVYDVIAYNTICSATEERQAEAARLAGKVDKMLVIGGMDSSNSRKLFEICQGIVDTQFLQGAEDLDLDVLSSVACIGITAGASTPQYIIEEVQEKCHQRNKKKVLSRCWRKA